MLSQEEEKQTPDGNDKLRLEGTKATGTKLALISKLTINQKQTNTN